MTKNLTNPPPKQPHWMVVFTTYNLPEAHIVAGRLESENIPAMVHQALGASALGISIGALGEIHVVVHAENYETALKILHPLASNALPEDADQIIYEDEDDDSE
jgi:hypothetical protein